LNPTLNFTGLYNQLGIRNDAGGIVRLLTSIRNVTAAYTRTDGTFLPGYLPTTNILGYDFDRSAPGWGFLLGSQQDIRHRAAANGWMTTDTLQTQLYYQTQREDLAFRAMLEPAPDLNIEITANKIVNKRFNTTFRFNGGIGDFESVTPITSGDYSISFLSIA